MKVADLQCHQEHGAQYESSEISRCEMRADSGERYVATRGIRKAERNQVLDGLLLSLVRGKKKSVITLSLQIRKTEHTAGGLPAPRTIFSSIAARTTSFGSPMPTAM